MPFGAFSFYCFEKCFAQEWITLSAMFARATSYFKPANRVCQQISHINYFNLSWIKLAFLPVSRYTMSTRSTNESHKMKTVKQAYNAGVEVFAKHCLMYGTITHDKSMQDSGGKHWREYELIVQGEHVYILKCNGEVIRTEIYEGAS